MLFSYKIFTYLLSFSLVTFVYVYVLNLPGHITQSYDLVYEYYYTNATYSLLLDVGLVAFYMYVSNQLYTWFMLPKSDHALQLIVLLCTTIMISGGCMIYFKLFGNPKLFFTRWFKRAGYKAILYDVYLVSLIYLLFRMINVLLHDPMHME